MAADAFTAADTARLLAKAEASCASLLVNARDAKNNSDGKVCASAQEWVIQHDSVTRTLISHCFLPPRTTLHTSSSRGRPTLRNPRCGYASFTQRCAWKALRLGQRHPHLLAAPL